MTQTLPQQHIELSSTPENLAIVENLVEQLQELYNLNADILGNILVSLSEAVNNAILHGNKSDITKTVTIDYTEQPHKLAFMVTDEGLGFDYGNIADPTAPENLTKLTGRGVFLMKQLADKVEFENQGRTVHLEFVI